MNINLNSNKAGISCTPEYEAPRSTQYHFCGIFPKLHNHDLVMRNHDKPKLRDILQNNWPVVFKDPKVMKDKDWGRRQDK